MRMAPNEFGRYRLHHVAEVEGALLLTEAGMEDNLKQQVAQFILEIGEIAAGDGIGDLVGFLDGVRRDGGEALLKIPRTTGLRRPQRRHDLDEAADIA